MSTQSAVLSSAPWNVSLLLGFLLLWLVFIVFGSLSYTGFPEMPDNSGMFVILRRKHKTRLEIVYMAGCEWSRGEQFFFVVVVATKPAMEEPPGLAAGRVEAGWSHGIYGICDPLHSVWSRAKVNRVLPRECTGHTKTCYDKGRGTRDQIANIHWIIKKQGGSRETSISALSNMPKLLTVWKSGCRSANNS